MVHSRLNYCFQPLFAYNLKHVYSSWCFHLTYLELGNFSQLLSGGDEKSDIKTETICLHQQKPQSSDSRLHNTTGGDS